MTDDTPNHHALALPGAAEIRDTMQPARRGLRGGDRAFGLLPQPHSISAEQYFLSCCLLDGPVAIGCGRAAHFVAETFYAPAHQIIWKKILAMEKAGKPVDTGTLYEELKLSGQLDDIGGLDYLTDVSGRISTSAQLGYFIGVLRSLWIARVAIKRSSDLIEAAAAVTTSGRHEEIHELIGDHVMKLQRLVDFAARSGQEPLGARMDRRLQLTLAAAAGKVDRSRWIYFGMPWLDACIKPLDTRAEDWLNIIGGPPSGGKSSFMRHVALHNLGRGKRVAVFLLETGLRWADAAAATLARVNLRYIENGEAMPDMVRRYGKMHRALQEMAGVNLFLFEDLFYVEDIERQIREVNRGLRDRDIARGVKPEDARGLDLVIVDYLQIVGTRQNFRGNREQVVSHVSMSLKKLFKSLDIVGLVGAQINRAAREDSAKAPTLAALRESGAIEQDADRVIFVHTPPNNKAGMPQDGNCATDEVEIVQRKSRNGPRDISVGVLFHKMQTRYEEPPQSSGAVRPSMPKPADGYRK